MLDPASAIGLTASIIEIVTFTQSILSESRKLHASADGALVGNIELETVASSFQRLVEKQQLVMKESSKYDQDEDSGVSVLDLRKHNHSTPFNAGKPQTWGAPRPRTGADKTNTYRFDEDDSQLESLGREVNVVIEEIKVTLESLKIKSPENTKWQSIRKALESVLKESRLRELEHRMDRFRKEIDTRLLVSLRKWVDLMQESQRQQNLEIQNAMKILVQGSKTHSHLLQKLMQRAPRNTYSDNRPLPGHFSVDLLALIVDQNVQDRTKILENLCVESLKFEDMPNRHEAIAEAYHKTFEWAFSSRGPGAGEPLDTQRQWDSFSDWLCGDQHLYWITGKPGAGKSTLSKFLAHHPRTRELFQAWASSRTKNIQTEEWRNHHHTSKSANSHNNELFEMASFFFWNSGTDMQMSRLGLLQSLLFQLLQKYPERAPQLFPERWRRYTLFGGDSRPFAWPELRNALNTLLSATECKFLLFIDGLDELDGTTGELAELADFVIDLSKRSNVKVCVASRPWTIFEDKFDERPMLRIEDLTHQDISTFITGKLGASKRFRELQKFRPIQAQSLVNEIADKAAGVFLWVFLVVEALLEGLRDGDDFDGLQRRLRSLPADLENLFEKILENLSPNFVIEASEFFQFVRSFPKESTLLSLSYFRTTLSDVIGTDIAPLPDNELQFIIETTRRRIYSRCKCLLEASPNSCASTKVTFLHRTARDFLIQTHRWSQIEANTPLYHPEAALAKSLLMQTKTTNKDSNYDRTKFWREALAMAALNFSAAQKYSVDDKIVFLDEVERTGRSRFFQDEFLPLPLAEDLWMSKLGKPAYIPQVAERALSIVSTPHDTLHLAFAADLDWYVSARLNKHSKLLQASNESSLFESAIVGKLWSMLPILFELDKHYTSQFVGYDTAWVKLLTAMELDLENENRWTENGVAYMQASRLFLEHDANPQLLIADSPDIVKAKDIIFCALNVSTRRNMDKEVIQSLRQSLVRALNESIYAGFGRHRNWLTLHRPR